MNNDAVKSAVLRTGGGGYLSRSRAYKDYHYSVMPPEQMNYLHAETLKMLREIVPVFERNSICWMICGGTLLGACTAGKFIPWDDDVDICILEADYERAIECLIHEVPDWMAVQWFTTEPKYYHGWAKVRDRKSHVYPDTAIYRENGVWIDLYKLKHVRRAEIPYLVAQEHKDYLDRRLRAGDISEEEYARRIESNNLVKRIQEGKDYAARSADREEEYIIWSASKVAIAEESCFPRRRYKFEGMELYGFRNAEDYLVRHYGENYGTLPPEEHRRIGISSVIFEEDTL